MDCKFADGLVPVAVYTEATELGPFCVSSLPFLSIASHVV